MGNGTKYTSKSYFEFDKLDKAEIKEVIKRVKKDKINYPSYHIAPFYGLLNDPNGLIYYNDEYHIFYQHCPNGPIHGRKQWYHLTTKDFINYNDRGIGIFSEFEFENFGIYSGGALEISGKLNLFYTGNSRNVAEDYKRYPYQCVAIMNKQYNIIKKKVLIKPDFSLHTEHFRDPVAIKVKDVNFLLVGRENINNQGEYVLYKTNE